MKQALLQSEDTTALLEVACHNTATAQTDEVHKSPIDLSSVKYCSIPRLQQDCVAAGAQEPGHLLMKNKRQHKQQAHNHTSCVAQGQCCRVAMRTIGCDA